MQLQFRHFSCQWDVMAWLTNENTFPLLILDMDFVIMKWCLGDSIYGFNDPKLNIAHEIILTLTDPTFLVHVLCFVPMLTFV